MMDTTLLRNRLEAVWRRSDLLLSIVPDKHLMERPISLRHPFLFYLGHLPAFAWNQLQSVLGTTDSCNPRFDAMFARGIDPDVMDPSKCHPHSKVPCDADDRDEGGWPSAAQVRQYRESVRDKIRKKLFDRVADLCQRLHSGENVPRSECPHIELVVGMKVFWMIIEHEVMHQETLLYMIVQLDHVKKARPPEIKPETFDFEPSLPAEELEKQQNIPAGTVSLGVNIDDNPRPFGWDNEFPQMPAVSVGEFRVDKYPITNGMFLEFIRAGGYQNERLWRSACDWEWHVRDNLCCPASWRCCRTDIGDQYSVRTLFEDVPIELAANWPVFVSGAEAHAYCQWRGRRLLTEAEFQRAAFGDLAPDAVEAQDGNFDFRTWAPLPVVRARGNATHVSPFGVHDLIGNGWEHTSTEFQGFEGFKALHPTYPGYSTDFFDGKHFVVKGASFATDACLVRPSFRNWYQFNYPFVFAKFRTTQSV